MFFVDTIEMCNMFFVVTQHATCSLSRHGYDVQYFLCRDTVKTCNMFCSDTDAACNIQVLLCGVQHTCSFKDMNTTKNIFSVETEIKRATYSLSRHNMYTIFKPIYVYLRSTLFKYKWDLNF